LQVSGTPKQIDLTEDAALTDEPQQAKHKKGRQKKEPSKEDVARENREQEVLLDVFAFRFHVMKLCLAL
jgi:hypothetical protein